MDVLHARCAGLDVHRDSVVACARLVTADGTAYEVARFGTMAADLERLATWLAARGVTQVAMEATGVYWKPVWAVLAAQVELTLANAAHVKNVPGRKTDVNDATWLADLLAPRPDPRELRAWPADPGVARSDPDAQAAHP